MKRENAVAFLLHFVAVVALVSSMLLATWLLRNFELPAALRFTVALLPIPLVIFVLCTNTRWLRACDELQQRIQLEALAFAFPVSFVGAYFFEYLRKAGLLSEWVM